MDEGDAYESVILDGQKVIQAMKILAMRLDRGAYLGRKK